ncbi:hypothetical protein [Egbenema bharatensis]|uniref:hypothetical protein n=1 Tax=Egbenema bharatensis TaxID=3463334 RepID=UPI003A89CFD6
MATKEEELKRLEENSDKINEILNDPKMDPRTKASKIDSIVKEPPGAEEVEIVITVRKKALPPPNRENAREFLLKSDLQ